MFIFDFCNSDRTPLETIGDEFSERFKSNNRHSYLINKQIVTEQNFYLTVFIDILDATDVIKLLWDIAQIAI